MENVQSFYVGSVFVDPLRRVICVGAEERYVESRVMDVLIRLIEKPGQVVTREEMLESVWPGVEVNDGALSKAISMLRSALRDNAKQPLFIETIPKIGYRVIAEVNYVELQAHTVNQRIDRSPSSPTKHHVLAQIPDIGKSFLRLKLRELTVAQLLVPCILTFVLYLLVPRPQVIEIEEEITWIHSEGTEVVDADSTWLPLDVEMSPTGKWPHLSVEQDTLIYEQ